jgi:hypothetical protein
MKSASNKEDFGWNVVPGMKSHVALHPSYRVPVCEVKCEGLLVLA